MLIHVKSKGTKESENRLKRGQKKESKEASRAGWNKNIVRLSLGLKEYQVIRLIGEPCEVRRTVSESGESDYWTHGFGPTLLFYNGVLVVIQY